MSNLNWFYFVDKQRFGPINSLELMKLAKSGKVAADTMLWREGLDDWVPARSVKGLFDHLPVRVATVPPPPPQSATLNNPGQAIPSFESAPGMASPTAPVAVAVQSPNAGASATASVSVAILTQPMPNHSHEHKSYRGMALTSMIIAMVGLLLFGFITGVIAVIFASVALSGMHRTGNRDGKGLAITGLVVGIIDVLAGWYIFTAILNYQ
ncbi:MAG TPA: GYF domain-containing protein [Tepidisphaeraceae bacterium]|jgi:hypothetical protein